MMSSTSRSEQTIGEYDYLLRVVLLGQAVGKTRLLLRFVEDIFPETFVSTVGVDFKIKSIELCGKRIKLQIWDTAGQERFRAIISGYVRGAHGIILGYDITDRDSFEAIEDFLRFARTYAPLEAVFALVGNQADLGHRRVVSFEEGQAFAEKLGISIFFETSAKTGQNVCEVFHRLTQDILIPRRLDLEALPTSIEAFTFE